MNGTAPSRPMTAHTSATITKPSRLRSTTARRRNGSHSTSPGDDAHDARRGEVLELTVAVEQRNRHRQHERRAEREQQQTERSENYEHKRDRNDAPVRRSAATRGQLAARAGWRLVDQPMQKAVQLVAVEIAEIPDVEITQAQPGRAFVFGTELHGLVVQRVDLLTRVDDERHHRAIATRRSIAVERLDHTEAGAVLARRPRDEAIRLHHAFAADLGKQCVIEFRGASEIVRAERYVTDHWNFLSTETRRHYASLNAGT